MRRLFLFLSFVLSAALAQQTSPKLEFEVASIKPTQPMPMGQMRVRMNTDAGMLRYVNVSLKDCIREAYRVKEYQIEGPDWLVSTRFDIQAKLPDGASKDQVPEMLQSLLADRFKLAIHRDKKDHAVYAMVTGKGGPKLKPAEIGTDPQIPPDAPKPPEEKMRSGDMPRGGMPRGGMMVQMGPGGMRLRAVSMTLPNLAEMLSRFCERPVVDMTGIEGKYDFQFSFMPETVRGLPGPPKGGPMPPPMQGGEGRGPVTGGMAGGGDRNGPVMGPGDQRPDDGPVENAGSIFDAVQRYGLKLEPRKAPMEVVYIDHIERTPTEN